MATCLRILAWEIPWREEPSRLQYRNLHKYRRLAQLHCLFPEEMNLEARIDTVPDLQHTQVVKNTDLEPGR